MKISSLLIVTMALLASQVNAATFNKEKTIEVNGTKRSYVLYVPDKTAANPALVISLHGASGHSTDRSPFRTSVADSEGCIVAYPQGLNQNFGPFGTVPGWDATGQANIDLDFFKSIIDDVAMNYNIDRNRVYCCGFSNGGMMTYSNASSASDIFAAFASISGFQLNEFHQRHTGYRPVPFMHIHGKADDFVKHSLMPIIVDNTTARNGCNPVPKVTEVAGKYTLSEYKAEEGGFPYIYYEIDGMGHSDYTDKTPDGNSALTMWKFMSQYTLQSPCDVTLKWRLNIDEEGYEPKLHSWKVNSAKTRYAYGTPRKANNADNNVYPSLQFEPGNYKLCLNVAGATDDKINILIEPLNGGAPVLSMSAPANTDAVMPFSTEAYNEYKITILKSSPDIKFRTLAIYSCEVPVSAVNSQSEAMPEEEPEPETGCLIEITQSQGKEYDDFSRTAFQEGTDYNTYTATADLQIAFKMMNLDVKDCDYVLVKFAEPVASGWKIAFWEGTNTVEIPAGTSEYKFELEPSMLASGRLPQICMMTLFGGYQSPLVAKVAGVYKHSLLEAPDGLVNIENEARSYPIAYYSLNGNFSGAPFQGVNIVKMTDGSTKKAFFR